MKSKSYGTIRWTPFVGLMVIMILASALAANDAPTSQPEAGAQPLTIAFIGASATHGFGVHRHDPPEPVDNPLTHRWLSLAEVFETADAGNALECSSHSSAMFFSNAMFIGPRLLKQADARKPDVIVGVDLMFWFGYGHLNVEGKPIMSEDDRLALLDHGLSLLDDFDGAIVLGNFPDMSDAVGLMLSEAQMPEPATLTKLNQRLTTWAEQRDDVHIIDLAGLIENMKNGEPFTVGERAWTAEEAASLLQSDQLHPTREGMAALALMIAEIMVDNEILSAEQIGELRPAAD